MLTLNKARLELLRDQLRVRGQRNSVVLKTSLSPGDLADALEVVEEWGTFCEAMYLMMVADGRVRNVERAVLRGALSVLSGERVRTTHMEAMLDAAARKVAKQGVRARLAWVMDSLRNDPPRAELAVLVAAAIAAADNRLAPEEKDLLEFMMVELDIDTERANSIMDDLASAIDPAPPGAASA